MRDKLIALLRPFRGVDVRRLTAFALGAIALPRLPFWPGVSTVDQLTILPQDVFGWLTLLVALGLFATTGCCRTHITGRMIAMLAFVLLVTLAAASSSVTSIGVNLAFAYAMLGEIGAEPHDV